jgi:Citrate synthase
VLDMLDAIGDAEQADAWFTAALCRGERLMGLARELTSSGTFVRISSDPHCSIWRLAWSNVLRSLKRWNVQP